MSNFEKSMSIQMELIWDFVRDYKRWVKNQVVLIVIWSNGNINNRLDEDTLAMYWVNKFASKYREIFESGNTDKKRISKLLYN